MANYTKNLGRSIKRKCDFSLRNIYSWWYNTTSLYQHIWRDPSLLNSAAKIWYSQYTVCWSEVLLYQNDEYSFYDLARQIQKGALYNEKWLLIYRDGGVSISRQRREILFKTTWLARRRENHQNGGKCLTNCGGSGGSYLTDCCGGCDKCLTNWW